MDKELIEVFIVSLAVFYMYYSAIRGIIRKKFRPIMLMILFGLKSREAGKGGFFKKLEGEEAVKVAIVQIFIASLIAVAVSIWILNEKLSLISYDFFRYAVPPIIIIIAIVSIIYIVKA